MSDASVLLPRIWVGGPDGSSAIGSDCGCGSACPHVGSSGKTWTSDATFVECVSGGDLVEIRANQDAYVGDLDGYTTSLGAKGRSMVVLDAEASRLLSYLPGTVRELRARFPEWPTEVFERSIALLLDLDALCLPSSMTGPKPQYSGSGTLTAWLHLTSQCNLLCKYCYVTKNRRQMDPSTAHLSVAAVFRAAAANGYTRVRLKYAGGEPTLNFSALRAAQAKAEALSAQTGVSLEAVVLTNGVRLTDKHLDTLLAHGIDVAVSLDGVGSCQDVQRPLIGHSESSFELVGRSIDRLLRWGLIPHISITITKLNLSRLPSLLDYLLDRQLTFSLNFYREPDRATVDQQLAFTPPMLIEGMKQAYQVIERRPPKYSLLPNLADRADLRMPHSRTCGVGQDYLVIDCSGNVSKCQMDMQHSVTTIYAGDPLAMVRADTHHVQNPEVDEKECHDCIWRYRCAGGCPRLTFQHTGRYDARSPLCEVYQAILPRVVRLEALRLLKYEEPWSFDRPLT